MIPRKHALVLLVLASLVGCRQVLGIEEASLLCPPELPGCTICQEAADCPAADECHAWACQDNLCTPVNDAVGTKCSRGVCSDDAVSVCVACMTSKDCPGGQCRDHRCTRCDDGIQNGWETGVDCGGGGACKECLGTPCQTANDCKSGFCVDGHCCVAECDIICAWCVNPEGDCRPIPKYTQDFDPVVCAGENICNGEGLCLLRAGEICVNPVECASARCVQNRCRKLAGEECFFPQECANDSCVGGKCQD